MPCYHPLTAWQKSPGEQLIFAQPEWGATHRGGAYTQLQIACGQCSGCRLKRSRLWAMRCIHEAQMHKHNCYITLTYNDENLPRDNTLHYYDFQRFMRRLRKALGRKKMNPEILVGPTDIRATKPKAPPPTAHSVPPEGEPIPGAGHRIRFYMAGEYGELTGRPHFHAILFGINFADQLYHKTTPAGEKIYTSPTLMKLWPHGYSSVGKVTFNSAAYVARYIMKKRTGDGEQQYQILNPETGEIHTKKKEFNNMSRKPGIAIPWLEKYRSDVYTTGKVIVRGHPQYPPRAYDKWFKKLDQAALEDFQHQRYLEQIAQHEHHSPERLAVQELVAHEKTRTLKRNLD